MLLHLNFCIEWFDSNSKEESKSFENALKYLKILSSSQLSAHPSLAARFLPCAWPVSRSPVSPLGPSPTSASGLAHARTSRFPSLRVADIAGPLARRAPFLKPTPSSLSKITDAVSDSQSRLSLFLSAFGLYKPNRTHLVLVVVVVVLESSVTASRSPSRRHSEPRVSFGPSPAPFSREVSSSCSVLPPRVFLSLNRARNRVFTFSGDGAAAGLAVVTVFRPEHRRRLIRSDPSIHLVSNG
jgi:hypothetical protein